MCTCRPGEDLNEQHHASHLYFPESLTEHLDATRFPLPGVEWSTIRSLDELMGSPSGCAKVAILDETVFTVDDQARLCAVIEWWASEGLIIWSYPEGKSPPDWLPSDCFWAYLRTPPALAGVQKLLRNAFQFVRGSMETETSRQSLQVQARQLKQLNSIGMALSSERDPDNLLAMILEKGRELVQADAGSLYLVEKDEVGGVRLRFKLSQNDSVSFLSREFTVPVSHASIAGHVALTGRCVNLPDVYVLPEGVEYAFDPTFDQMTGYRTRSMLVVPMRNRDGELLGILQLINRKRSAHLKLVGHEAVASSVIPFDEACEELLLSLASQAAVAVENNLLYKSIEGLFEGFVNASVQAIESRDPTTSGHSVRVAELTVGLATLVDGLDTGPFADVRFTTDQLREIRYASLLHDFGKVGVREEVLVKAKKLYPQALDLLRSRFSIIRLGIENRHLRLQLEHCLTHGVEHFHGCRHDLETACTREKDELALALATILQANEPTVLEEGRFHHLLEIATRTYLDEDGLEQPWLTPREVNQLSIRRGTLDGDERREIESHVVHTFRFLRQIPWTRDLASVPLIAESHHEKLNGMGYPHGLVGEAIPVQSRMMTIADIFDALTASDRPYKKAVPLERALDILGHEARDGHVDRRLLDLFIEGRVYERVVRPRALQP